MGLIAFQNQKVPAKPENCLDCLLVKHFGKPYLCNIRGKIFHLDNCIMITQGRQLHNKCTRTNWILTYWYQSTYVLLYILQNLTLLDEE